MLPNVITSQCGSHSAVNASETLFLQEEISCVCPCKHFETWSNGSKRTLEFDLYALIGIVLTVLVADTSSPLCLSLWMADEKKRDPYNPQGRAPVDREAIHSCICVIICLFDSPDSNSDTH